MSDSNRPLKSVKTNNIKHLHPDSDHLNLGQGRVMPQAISIEEAVLGALMINEDAMSIVTGILTPDSFYLPAHQKIFTSMLELFEQSIPIDILSVKERLKKKSELDSIGGPPYLAELTNRVGTSANLEYHARYISEKFIQRELIRISTKTVKDAFEDTKDVFEMLNEAEQDLFAVTQGNVNHGYESIRSLTIQARKQLETLAEKEDGLTGVPSGYTKLDLLTSGWQKQDLIIVAARPSMGKTALTLCYARNAALDYQIPVAMFSLEMSGVQLTQRLISMEARIPASDLRNGRIKNEEWRTLNEAMDRVSDAPIFIDDTPAINIFELRAKCRRLKMQHDIGLVIIDYLQLMSGGVDSKSRGNREQEISSISRALKALAKELDVPVIALSQLSREVEKRGGNKRPVLSDLRESGAIEQDADIVTFIYRPEYYELPGKEDNDRLNENEAEIIIAKHRNGALGTVHLNFVKEYALFEDQIESSFHLPLKGQYDFNQDSPFITRDSKVNGDHDDSIPF